METGKACFHWRTSSTEAASPKSPITFPNSATNGDPSIQMHDPGGQGAFYYQTTATIFPASMQDTGEDNISTRRHLNIISPYPFLFTYNPATVAMDELQQLIGIIDHTGPLISLKVIRLQHWLEKP